MSDALDDLLARHETELHRGVHRWMSEPARVLQTTSGNRLQILSPGHYNPHGGPDFEDAAVLLGGTVLSGAIEFDKRRSYWSEHHHDTHPAYSRVILHAVLIDDDPARKTPDAVVIPTDELLSLLKEEEGSSDTVSFDELQSYALLRLLRQSSEHTEYYRGRSVREGFVLSVRAFLERYASKRRRPRYTAEQFDRLVGCAARSPQAAFLEHIVAGVPGSVPQQLSALCDQPIAGEGQRLRSEIVTNCVVPSACVLAGEQLRIGVFTWYWSARARNRYAVLGREFPHIPQSFVWQQQGMLEMLRHRTLPVALGEVFRQYSTLLALDFYRAAHEPPLLEDER